MIHQSQRESAEILKDRYEMEGAVDILFEDDQTEVKATGENSKVDCSHRVIEKRRRDRINNSLLELSKLVPVEKLNKRNSGKLEKAEILELTVNYLSQQQFNKDHKASQTLTTSGTSQENQAPKNDQDQRCVFLQGFTQCITEATKFFQDIEELCISEGRCYRLIQHLKRQVTRYEGKNENILRIAMEDRRVWDHQDKDSNQAKRKNGNIDGSTSSKKPRSSFESNGEEQAPGELNCSSGESTMSNSNSQSNYLPFIFPNIPMFSAFAGANNIPHFQATQSQFPGYQYQQSTPQYIPVALPQFPTMGMNFLPGFGMMNSEQVQNGGGNAPVHSGIPNNAMPGLMPTGMPNGFFPSMYTNGLHANIMAMRPRDSGYESSEKSSSSKTSGSESSQNSMQSFSDE